MSIQVIVSLIIVCQVYAQVSKRLRGFNWEISFKLLFFPWKKQIMFWANVSIQAIVLAVIAYQVYVQVSSYILRLWCIKIRNYFIKCKNKKLIRLDLNVNQIRTVQATIAPLQVYAQVGLYNHNRKIFIEIKFILYLKSYL